MTGQARPDHCRRSSQRCRITEVLWQIIIVTPHHCYAMLLVLHARVKYPITGERKKAEIWVVRSTQRNRSPSFRIAYAHGCPRDYRLETGAQTGCCLVSSCAWIETGSG